MDTQFVALLLLSVACPFQWDGSSSFLPYQLTALPLPPMQVRGCLYNQVFRVVVTADEGGAVCVWNVNNGQREGRFLKAHGDARVRHARHTRLCERMCMTS